MSNFVPVSTLEHVPPVVAASVDFEASAPVVLRRAAMQDIPALLSLINAYARLGIMLPRTEFEMAENIRDFTVLFSGNQLVGCAALHFYGPTMGEIRSLAVDPRTKGQGFGRLLVEQLVLEAQAFSLGAVFAFTYVDRFFEKLNFVKVDRGYLPLKAWKDCLKCPKFQCCDEIAMVRHLA